MDSVIAETVRLSASTLTALQLYLPPSLSGTPNLMQAVCREVRLCSALTSLRLDIEFAGGWVSDGPFSELFGPSSFEPAQTQIFPCLTNVDLSLSGYGVPTITRGLSVVWKLPKLQRIMLEFGHSRLLGEQSMEWLFQGRGLGGETARLPVHENLRVLELDVSVASIMGINSLCQFAQHCSKLYSLSLYLTGNAEVGGQTLNAVAGLLDHLCPKSLERFVFRDPGLAAKVGKEAVQRFVEHTQRYSMSQCELFLD